MNKQQRQQQEAEFTMLTIASMVKTFGTPSICMGALAQVVATYLAVWETSPEENERIIKEFAEDITERLNELRAAADKAAAQLRTKATGEVPGEKGGEA